MTETYKNYNFKTKGWCLMKKPRKGCELFPKYKWTLCQFSHTERVKDSDGYDQGIVYVAVGGNIFGQCIPYNEQTKHLLGTTEE